MANKKLYRNEDGSVIAGVCNGIADYFDIDEKDGSLTFYKFNNNVEEDIVFFCCWCKVKFVRKVDK